MRFTNTASALALGATLLAACGGGSGTDGSAAQERASAMSQSAGPGSDNTSMRVKLSVLSSAPQYVSGGDARIHVRAAPGQRNKLVFLLNGQPTAPALSEVGDGLEGVVGGLVNGKNTLEVRHRSGNQRDTLELVNWPITGPIFSGPKLTPFECRTSESGLGAPTDTACSAATRYDWFYYNNAGTRAPLTDPLGPRPADLATTTTIDGATVPMIVRVESGTINRSIVRIAVLDDPQAAGTWNSAGWNRRIVFRVGESTAAQYNQGQNNFNEVFKDERSLRALQQGYAYVISSLNVNKTNVNDAVSAETMMMVRERIAKRYGLPKWMVGWGGSGGAIQQMLVAQNYPGLLDGILPDAAFPDVFGTAQAVSDCRLLNRYFIAHPASDAVRLAFEGHLKNTCRNWDAGNGDAVLATSGSINPPCGLNDQSKVYNPVTNPTGARCTVYDINATSLTRDPATGAARRPLDNVGIQYGLASLKAGKITPAQFLEVNEGVGGFDTDGNIVATRTAADPLGLRNAYAAGRVAQGGGGLATTPILHLRAYAEPGADIHTIYNDIAIREKLKRANGRADNQVIWVLPNPDLAVLLGLGTAQRDALRQLYVQVVYQQLDLMRAWLDGLTADSAPLTADKVAQHKPADAVDSCWNVTNGQRIKEEATYDGAGTCNTLYKKTPPPRMVAGAPITDDTLKCHLKPINDADYLPAVFAPAEKLRLEALFPGGVCDYSKPGVEQVPLKGTWQVY